MQACGNWSVYVCVCASLSKLPCIFISLCIMFSSSCSMNSLDLTEDGSSDNLAGDSQLENSLATADSSSVAGSLDLSKGSNQKGSLFDIGEEGREDKVSVGQCAA